MDDLNDMRERFQKGSSQLTSSMHVNDKVQQLDGDKREDADDRACTARPGAP